MFYLAVVPGGQGQDLARPLTSDPTSGKKSKHRTKLLDFNPLIFEDVLMKRRRERLTKSKIYKLLQGRRH